MGVDRANAWKAVNQVLIRGKPRALLSVDGDARILTFGTGLASLIGGEVSVAGETRGKATDWPAPEMRDTHAD
jgi:hypothetical protein